MPVIITITLIALDYEWLSACFQFLNEAFFIAIVTVGTQDKRHFLKMSCTRGDSPSLFNDKAALANKLVQGLCSSVLQIFFAAHVTLRITHVGWPTTWKSVWTDKNDDLERVRRSLHRRVRDSHAHVVEQVLLSMKSVFFMRNGVIRV